VLYDPRDVSPKQALAAARDAASKLGLSILEREVRNDSEVMSALQSLVDADAFLALPGGIPSAHYGAIIRATHAKRLPAMVHSRTAGAVEALASYGVSDVGVAREAARLVSKVMNGEDAGDLPVERPTKLQFVINLRTATALGVTVPPMVLARADEVIE
jgi:putative ABC transport system substrate-binding protein